MKTGLYRVMRPTLSYNDLVYTTYGKTQQNLARAVGVANRIQGQVRDLNSNRVVHDATPVELLKQTMPGYVRPAER